MLAFTACGGDNGGNESPIKPTPETPSDNGSDVKARLTIDLAIDKVSHVWVASPDNLGGVPQELSFSQNGSSISFTLPSLKYWDMIVIE